VGGNEDADPELGADAADQVEHLVASGRVEAVGRFVQEHELRVVDEGLRELHPLAHPGGVAADRAVALLVQADVPERVGGAFAGGGRGEAAHAGHVHDELGRGHVRRQAVVFGHESDALPDPQALARDVEPQHGRGAGRRRQQPEQDLDERRLAGAVGSDQPDDTRFDGHVEVVQGGHPGEPHRQALGGDYRHGPNLAAGSGRYVTLKGYAGAAFGPVFERPKYDVRSPWCRKGATRLARTPGHTV
jgi:hypothetical protein